MVFRRSKNCARTRISVKYGDHEIEQVDSYKYLGVTIEETITFSTSYVELANSASKALGAIINKSKHHRDIGFKTFDKLIQSCVFSIMDYGAEVTGLRSHHSLEDVQNRAARFYLGVNKFCPLPCLNLEMGWLTCYRRRHLCVIRYYNRLVNLESGRLPRKIFMSSRNNQGSWAFKVRELLNDIVLDHYWDTLSAIPTDIARLMIREKCKEELANAVDDRIKLRTYKTLYCGLSVPVQVRCPIGKRQRSLLTQLKCGTLHLRIETGRFVGEKLHERLCPVCDGNQIESEHLFVFDCSAYDEDRDKLITTSSLDRFPANLKEFFEHPFVMGKFVEGIWHKRNMLLVN